MSSSPQKLPLWVFYLIDALLVVTGLLIGYDHPRPWSEGIILAIVGCFLGGAVILFVPLIAYYERQKNEMLDDRQRALEALARTVTTSAEQISIATSGLHEITEIAQRNLKHAEQLPHRLQEKIAEFQAQLANANDTEREELEKELEELRSSESERLQSISDKIAKTATEMAKVEASAHQHLSAANDAVAKLSLSAAGAIGKAQVAAEQAFAQARQEAIRQSAEGSGAALKAIEAAKAAALTDFTAQVDAALKRIHEATTPLSAAIARLETLAASASSISPTAAAPATTPDLPPTPPGLSGAGNGSETAAPAETASETPAPAETIAHPPKRSRKRREESPSPAESPAAEPSAASPAPATPDEPVPITSEKIVEVAPVVPETKDPFTVQPAPTPNEGDPAAGSPSGHEAPNTPSPTTGEPESGAGAESAKPVRKRAPKKAEDDQPALGLPLDESLEPTASVVERVLTSDGATRLIVTAYIGIGNRLFIRGSGPGLSWDKGVPLQFVSIGKWRWETNEATAPVEFKLLKNDEQETNGLGTLTIDPGHQHEVTATFH